MMDVPHIGFIVAAYAVTAAVMLGAVMVVLLDRRALLRALDRLDPRRSAVIPRQRASAPPVDPS